MRRWVRFWITGYGGLSDGELVIRFRRWWHRHWWPARIAQLDRERLYWKSLVRDHERKLWRTPMSSHTDIRVRTSNPKALDETVQQLPGVAAAVIDGSWNGDTCVVRVLAGDPEFLRFAITNQGYGLIVEDTDE